MFYPDIFIYLYILLVYDRSCRKGFVFYVMGQLKEIGMKFYNTEIDIDIIQVTEGRNNTHIVLQVRGIVNV